MLIVKKHLAESQYIKTAFEKRQIVVHHSVSDPRYPERVGEAWANDALRIATAYSIGGDGKIVENFDPRYYASHLGIKGISKASNIELDKSSIGIEICAWGGLTMRDGKLYNAYGGEVNPKFAEQCRWRGYEWFGAYTNFQLESLAALLKKLSADFGISITGIAGASPISLEVSADALAGKKGIYSHSNYRADKSDLYPSPALLNMLKKL